MLAVAIAGVGTWAAYCAKARRLRLFLLALSALWIAASFAFAIDVLGTGRYWTGLFVRIGWLLVPFGTYGVVLGVAVGKRARPAAVLGATILATALTLVLGTAVAVYVSCTFDNDCL